MENNSIFAAITANTKVTFTNSGDFTSKEFADGYKLHCKALYTAVLDGIKANKTAEKNRAFADFSSAFESVINTISAPSYDYKRAYDMYIHTALTFKNVKSNADNTNNTNISQLTSSSSICHFVENGIFVLNATNSDWLLSMEFANNIVVENKRLSEVSACWNKLDKLIRTNNFLMKSKIVSDTIDKLIKKGVVLIDIVNDLNSSIDFYKADIFFHINGSTFEFYNGNDFRIKYSDEYTEEMERRANLVA